MDFLARTGSVATARTDCAVVGVYRDGSLSAAAREVDGVADGLVARLVRRRDFTGRKGDTLLLAEPSALACQRLLLVGLGDRGKLDLKGWRRAHAAAVGALLKLGAKEAYSFLSSEDVAGADVYALARHAAEAAEEVAYRFDEMKSKTEDELPVLRRLLLWVPDRKAKAEAERGFGHAAAIAEGQSLARTLGNLPANVCTPTYLASRARKLARGKLKVSALAEAEMKKLGMGSLLSVSRGSRQPPRLIVMEWKGGARNAAPVVLVGKGVTFDTGGVCLKPPQALDEMKFDMCGAAGVIGTLAAVAAMELPLNVVGIVPAVENMPDGLASRPGDIVKSLSGQTIEILNTDAEGRLILCDALTYARRFEPAAIVDVATLTGACVIALGHHMAGLMSPRDELAAELLSAGIEAEDRAWRLPIAEEYDEELKSNFADFANVAGREGGAITAACFLARFTRDLEWAHLDIAGVAYRSGPTKGATGRPVPLLCQFLLNRAARAGS
jgi:leucyl aminopeptidase